MQTSTQAPVRQRHQDIDALRGFALFGVLLVNATMINATLDTFASHPLNNPWLCTLLSERLANLFVQLLAQGKFYTLFTFLFGYSFYWFKCRQEEKNLDVNLLFKKRLLILLCFGLLNFIFVWYGDILHVYAIIGFFLPQFVLLGDKTLLRWSLGLMVFYCLALSGLLTLEAASHTQLPLSADLSAQSIANQYYLGKNYLSLVSFRTTHELPLMLGNLIVLSPRILSVFLFGYWAARAQWLATLKQVPGTYQRVRKWALLLFCTTTTLVLLLQLTQPSALGFFYVGLVQLTFELQQISGALVYMLLFLSLHKRFPYATIFKSFASMGRLTLSNYIFQCILLAFVFYGPGLGLMYQVDTGFSILLSIGLYSLQMIMSPIWLKWFEIGPLEKLWRIGIYGK